jgi:hypothetical protein
MDQAKSLRMILCPTSRHGDAMSRIELIDFQGGAQGKAAPGGRLTGRARNPGTIQALRETKTDLTSVSPALPICNPQ